MTRNINTNSNNILLDNTKYHHNRNNNSFVNQLNIATTSMDFPSNMDLNNGSNGSNQYQLLQQQQQHPPHLASNQSNSFDSIELQFHTNPINLGVNEFSSKSKTLPKGSGNKKYLIPLRNRDYNSLGLEGAVGGMENNLTRSAQHQDPKSTTKLFEALKENVYTEVTNLISANESRPHFLIQLFRELQLISSDPLRQRTIQSIQELYNRYVESTLIQEENNLNSIQTQAIQPLINTNNTNTSCSSQDLTSSIFEFDIQYRTPMLRTIDNVSRSDPNRGSQNEITPQSYELPPAQSTPRTSADHRGEHHIQVTNQNSQQQEVATNNSPDAGFINIIMNEIISAVHAVDYINDSILQKVTNIVFNHISDNSGHDVPNKVSRLIINNDDFLRQINHWNRTDKDEFITNLENYLNNILVECSNVAAANTTNNSSSNYNSISMDLNEASPSNGAYNGSAIFVDGDLAEADQICSNDENMEIEIVGRHGVEEGASGGNINSNGHFNNIAFCIDESNSEVLEVCL